MKSFPIFLKRLKKTGHCEHSEITFPQLNGNVIKILDVFC